MIAPKGLRVHEPRSEAFPCPSTAPPSLLEEFTILLRGLTKCNSDYYP